MRQVVKVQLPQASNDPNVKPLVYDKGRKRWSEQNIPQDVFKIVQARTPQKAFFWARWRGQNLGWDITRAEVQDPGW